MDKKLLYLAGASVAVGVAYLKGLSHGQEISESVEEMREVSESIDEGDIEEAEEELGEHIGRVADSTEEEITEEEQMVECEDEDCNRTFETEHGMKIHYGIEHDTDEGED